jgi:hypothetical protein
MTNDPTSADGAQAPSSLSRRDFLRVAGITGASAFICRPQVGTAKAPQSRALASKASSNVQVISGYMSAKSLTVNAGKTVRFDPHVTTTVELTGNAVIYGRLEMKPASPAVVHTLRFVGVDESKFVGGGMDVLDTDVGLWVMGDGVLDLAGPRRQPWNRIGVSDTWLPSDELIVTPTAIGDYSGFKPFTAGSQVPRVPGMPAAEVLNLTRNVRIEGTPSGRTHVIIMSTQPQFVRRVAIRYVGPRKNGTNVLGRYGLHFHHCGNASAGSMVTGTVVRDAGNHAFVPHMSNGITFRRCISYNTQEDAYWWDYGDSSDRIVFQDCVAARVLAGTEVYRLAGFVMGPSVTPGSNSCVRCVAVGVQGDVNSSGFIWDEDNEGIWVNEECLGHNNVMDGIFTWQNTDKIHDIDKFIGYRNGKAGIEHGAYVNSYQYSDAVLRENGQAGFYVHSQSVVDYPRPQLFTRPKIIGNGVTKYGMVLGLAPGFPPPPPGKGSMPSVAKTPSVGGCSKAYYQPDGLPISDLLTVT